MASLPLAAGAALAVLTVFAVVVPSVPLAFVAFSPSAVACAGFLEA